MSEIHIEEEANILNDIRQKQEQKTNLNNQISQLDTEIQTLKGKFLKCKLCQKIPEHCIRKVTNIEVIFDHQKPDNWTISYDHFGHPTESLYDYKNYTFIESVLDVDDEETDDIFDYEIEAEQFREQTEHIQKQTEHKQPPIKTHVTLSCMKQNTKKYFISVNNDKSRFAIFMMDGDLVIHNLDYKFDLSKKAQQELIKNYTYEDDIPEAVILAMMIEVIENDWSPKSILQDL